jgi:hypothetical protein
MLFRMSFERHKIRRLKAFDLLTFASSNQEVYDRAKGKGKGAGFNEGTL